MAEENEAHQASDALTEASVVSVPIGEDTTVSHSTAGGEDQNQYHLRVVDGNIFVQIGFVRLSFLEAIKQKNTYPMKRCNRH